MKANFEKCVIVNRIGVVTEFDHLSGYLIVPLENVAGLEDHASKTIHEISTIIDSIGENLTVKWKG